MGAGPLTVCSRARELRQAASEGRGWHARVLPRRPARPDALQQLRLHLLLLVLLLRAGAAAGRLPGRWPKQRHGPAGRLPRWGR